MANSDTSECSSGSDCVGLLAAGLVPFESMSPSEEEEGAWTTLFQLFQPQQSPGPMSQNVLDLLVTATLSDLATLQSNFSMMLALLARAIPQ